MFIMAKSLRATVWAASLGLSVAAGIAHGADNGKTYGFGTTATAKELEQFVSPTPDGKGLPKGSGTVQQGKQLFLQKCAACHGVNLEGGLADRLVGGRGTLVNSDPTKAPVKTVESYWPYATTLFDYIKRAMPFNAPGSLTNNEVYALSAYILSQGKVIDSSLTLNEKNLAGVKMPNRDGFIPDPRDHRP